MAAADLLSHPDRVWYDQSKWVGDGSTVHLGYGKTLFKIYVRGTAPTIPFWDRNP
jgi:hypothetical protein